MRFGKSIPLWMTVILTVMVYYFCAVPLMASVNITIFIRYASCGLFGSQSGRKTRNHAKNFCQQFLTTAQICSPVKYYSESSYTKHTGTQEYSLWQKISRSRLLSCWNSDCRLQGPVCCKDMAFVAWKHNYQINFPFVY